MVTVGSGQISALEAGIVTLATDLVRNINR